MGIFGWSYPPGAASDPYAPYNQDDDPSNEVCEEAFADYESLYDLYRAVYKGTDCGASIGVTVEDPEGNRKTVYCDRLRELGTWDDMNKQGLLIVAFSISSIVEGVDEGTSTHTIEVGDDSDKLSATFWEAIEAVENEALAIWNDTHGCEECAKHFGTDADELGPVWDECPNCKGKGIPV